MDFKLVISTFILVFLAELGDKTQLATFCLAAENGSKLSVFLGAAGALMITSLLAVLFGLAVSKMVPQEYVKVGAGLLFIISGVWMIFSK